MEIGVLMGLLGLGLMFGMGGSSDDDEEPADVVADTDDDPVVPVAPPEPEPVNQLVYDGSPTLVGTDGDDRLVYLDFTPENSTLMTQTEVIDGGLGDDYIEAGFFLNDNDFASTSGLIINGGDGDDTLSSNGIGSEFNGGDGNDLIDVAFNDTVNGGSGNDTIGSTGGAVVDGGTGDDALIGQYNDTQFGGAGNDVLSGASSMSGGDGNDTISGYYELSGGDGDDLLTSYANPYAAGDGDALGMSGDAGNDTLTASADIGYGNTPSVPGSTLVMSGGDGADLFDIQLNPVDSPIGTPTSTEPTQAGTYLHIADFNPDEDTLTIQINQNGSELGERPLTAVIIVNDEIVLDFQGQGDQTPFSTTIGLQNAEGISVDDLTIQYVDLAGNVSSVWEPDSNAGEVLTLPEDESGIIGTDGNDTLSVAFSEAYTEDYLPRFFGAIRLGDGDDLADVEIFSPNIDGGLGNDTIVSSDIDGRILGGDGDDLIVTYALNYIEGGDGNDTISGGEAEQIFGGAGDDVLSASAAGIYDSNGVLDGGTGDDTITASSAIGHWNNFASVDVIGGGWCGCR